MLVCGQHWLLASRTAQHGQSLSHALWKSKTPPALLLTLSSKPTFNHQGGNENVLLKTLFSFSLRTFPKYRGSSFFLCPFPEDTVAEHGWR